MKAVERALTRSRDLAATANALANRAKAGATAGDLISPSASGPFEKYRTAANNKQKYAQFRGWVYSAVNAIAEEAAKQPVQIGKLAGSTRGKGKPKSSKYLQGHDRLMMAKTIQNKAAAKQIEMILDHPLAAVLEKPNPIQYRWQFVYSFVANLCMTGWGYIIGDYDEDGNPTFFSVPTSWVAPKHDKGLFSEFEIRNPDNPSAKGEVLDRDQVAFAYLPNPGNLMSAYSPTSAQSAAIKIDDNIQSCELAFFDNGIFPSVIVTMGKNPHPDGKSDGVRQRLTATQRRQVYAAIRKVSGGIANYGNPAIVDSLIERIDRLSMTQNELGWDKSETKVRSRILSIFGVHPFILGEEMAGSYAQAFVVQDRFCGKVNVFLDLLSTIMTDFAPRFTDDEDDLLVWWREATANDPSMEKGVYEGARGRNDITQNEFRAWMGLPPDEDRNESQIDKSSVGAVAGVAAQVTKGELTPEQATAILTALGLADDIAKKIAGTGPKEPVENPDQGFDEDNCDQPDEGGFRSGQAILKCVQGMISA